MPKPLVDSAFPRRELFQKLASVALLLLVSRSKSAFTIPQKYPAPKFAIGDQIFSPYEDGDEDEDEDGIPEFGEVMGVCWNPRNEECEYIINWTSGSSYDWMYPVFDEFLIC